VTEIRILALAGSARAGSFNKQLVRVALRGAEEVGASTTFVDMRDYPLPLYDGDLERESGLPENAAALREIFLSHQGLLVATPEYNGGITPLLKNTLDWISRSPQASPDLAPYQGKLAVLMAASPGPLGGLRGIQMVRTVLTNLGVLVLPAQLTLRAAHEAFAESGDLAEPRQQERVLALGRDLATTARKLR